MYYITIKFLEEGKLALRGRHLISFVSPSPGRENYRLLFKYIFFSYVKICRKSSYLPFLSYLVFTQFSPILSILILKIGIKQKFFIE